MKPIFRVRGTEELRSWIASSRDINGITSDSQWFILAALEKLETQFSGSPELTALRRSLTRQPKTECPNGHPYSAENTKMRGNIKTCRQCHRDQVKKSAIKRK